MKSQNTKEDNIIPHFLKRLVVRQKKNEYFFQKIRQGVLFEYKKNTNNTFTYFSILTKKETLSGKTPKQKAWKKSFEDVVIKRGELYEQVRWAFETNYLIKKKDQDNLIKLLEESERVYERALADWRDVKTPEELIGDKGDEVISHAEQKEFEKKVRCLNKYINKMMRKNYIVIDSTILLIPLLIAICLLILRFALPSFLSLIPHFTSFLK